MLDSIIKTAENLGNQLAGNKKTATISGPSVEQTQSQNTTPPQSGQVFFKIKPFKENDFGISHWENLLRNLSPIKGDIDFYVIGNAKKIELYVSLKNGFQNHFENMYYSTYKTSELIAVQALEIPQDINYFHFKDGTEFTKRSTFTGDGTYIDPFKDVLGAFHTIDDQSKLTILFSLSYSQDEGSWEKFVKAVAKRLSFFFFRKKDDEAEESEVKETVDQTTIYMKMGYALNTSNQLLKDMIKSNLTSIMNIFITTGGVEARLNMPKTHKLERDQASNFFHIPTQANYVQQLDYAEYRRLPAPLTVGTEKNTPIDKLTLFGKTDYRGEPSVFGIKEEDKFRHVYIIGKTGTGKSTFLSNLIKSDIEAGNGVALLDPHGELVETVIEHIPKHRINDVILFDVSDDSFPVGFNLLQYKTEDEKLRVVSGVVSTFKKLFGHSWGPRLEYILRNILLSLVDYPNATLMHIMRMLTDKNFREEVLKFVKDSLLIKFWREEFDKWNDKQIQESIGPITNKVGQFLSSSIVRNIFGQPRAKLSLREAMDTGKIILINLSKGKIGDDNAEMIGSLLVTKFQIDAMARADMKKDDRRPFYLYIDEFQNFATESFATILSEARKYKLSIIVANQYSSQLLEEIRDAIFGNIGTIISFTLGYEDAKIISQQFKEMVSVNDMISLPRFTAYTRLMIDGITSDPFSMKSLPLPTPEGSEELIKKITEQSRQRYAMPRKDIESLIEARGQKSFSVQETVALNAKLEGFGFTSQEIQDFQLPATQRLTQLFRDYTLINDEADAALFDLEKGEHKAIWYEAVEGMEEETRHQDKKNEVDIYTHTVLTTGAGQGLEVLVGKPDKVREYFVQEGLMEGGRRKFVKNAQKVMRNATTNTITVTMPGTRIGHEAAEPNLQQQRRIEPQQGFTINDIEIGKEYEGYVKLLYNYGIFITVKGVEGLLHKNYIKDPAPGVTWKKFYNIGDKIKAYAVEFKEVDNQKRIIWSQNTLQEYNTMVRDEEKRKQGYVMPSKAPVQASAHKQDVRPVIRTEVKPQVVQTNPTVQTVQTSKPAQAAPQVQATQVVTQPTVQTTAPTTQTPQNTAQ